MYPIMISPLPDFITSDSFELMLSADFFAFLGAIVTPVPLPNQV